MIRILLLFLALSGLQAVPLSIPGRVQKRASISQLPGAVRGEFVPDGFRRGPEASRRFLVNLNTGLVQERISEMGRRVASIHSSLQNGKTERRRSLIDEVADDVPAEKNGGGWVRVEEPSASRLANGFRQGTEPAMSIPDGFRQGTEPAMSIPDGFRQGTEPFLPLADGFRQGTEPFMPLADSFRQGTEPFLPLADGFRQGTEPFLPLADGFRQGTEPFLPLADGFRQGTEPFLPLADGFRQGTEPFLPLADGFRQGTEPCLPLADGFRQGTEPSLSRLQKQTVVCKGAVINGNCYEFNATPLAFRDAQTSCKALGQNAELASVTNEDLHSRLVSLVTSGGESQAVLTWLGGIVKNQKASWVDGSEWRYSDWMPGHPNIHTDKPVCVEMFKIGESWWTANDCEERRAYICSYPINT